MGKPSTLALALLLATTLAATRPATPVRATITELTARLLKSPNDPGLHLLLADACLAAGDFKRAAIAAEEVSSLRWDALEFWRHRAETETGPRALLAARELARIAPGDCGVLRLAATVERLAGETLAAIALLDRALHACPPQIEALVAAEAQTAAGCDSRAVTLLEPAVVARPGDSALLSALAAARERVARRFAIIDRRIAVIDEAIGRSLDIAGANPARDLDPIWRETRRDLERAARDAPDDPEIELRLAALYRAGEGLGLDGSIERALAHAQTATELRPSGRAGLLLLGSIALALHPPRPDAAADAFLAALALDPEPLPQAWQGLFLAHLAAGRREVAQDDAARYLELRPGDREVIALRGEAR